MAYAADMVYVYSAPVRMDGSNAIALGGVLAIAGLAYANDDELLHAIDRPGGRIYDKVLDVGDFFEPLGLITRTHRYYEGAAIAGWVLDIPLLRTIPGEILESRSIAGSFRQSVERITHRRRPYENEGPRSFTGGSSLPSGHASVVCEVAAIVSYHAHHPLVRTAVWAIAGSTCLQRLGDRTHWPSDVVLGAAFGGYVGHTLARRNDERRRGIPQGEWYDITYRPKPRWTVVPFMDGRSVGLGASAVF